MGAGLDLYGLRRNGDESFAKRTFQPADYAADMAGFTANIEKDVRDKRRLLTALGMVKQ